MTLGAAPSGEDGGALLTVDDDGPGVADADRERIFAPFARLESTNGEGSGLGLALVEQQVRHHGARIDVGDSPAGRRALQRALRGARDATGLLAPRPLQSRLPWGA